MDEPRKYVALGRVIDEIARRRGVRKKRFPSTYGGKPDTTRARSMCAGTTGRSPLMRNKASRARVGTSPRDRRMG